MSVRLTLRDKSGEPWKRCRGIPTPLLGIRGFTLHRLDGNRSEWRLSHIETGALVARGPTQDRTVERAIEIARDRVRLLDGIERMRRAVEGAEGS